MIDCDKEPRRYFLCPSPKENLDLIFCIVLKQYYVGAVPHIKNGKPCRTITESSFAVKTC